MASRSKRKQAIAERMQFQQIDREISMAKVQMDIAMEDIMETRSDFRSEMELKNEAFRRGINARQEVLSLIERNDALKKRVQEVYDEGRKAGFKEAGWPIIKCCMAGACLMLREEFGFEDDDIIRGLKTLHEKTAWALNYSELAEEVLKQTGIELQLDDPLEPIREIR